MSTKYNSSFINTIPHKLASCRLLEKVYQNICYSNIVISNNIVLFMLVGSSPTFVQQPVIIDYSFSSNPVKLIFGMSINLAIQIEEIDLMYVNVSTGLEKWNNKTHLSQVVFNSEHFNYFLHIRGYEMFQLSVHSVIPYTTYIFTYKSLQFTVSHLSRQLLKFVVYKYKFKQMNSKCFVHLGLQCPLLRLWWRYDVC